MLTITEDYNGEVQTITLSPFESEELYRYMSEYQYPGIWGKGDVTNIPQSGNDPLKEVFQYLIIESRMSGGKKKNVLNWCEDEYEALDTIKSMVDQHKEDPSWDLQSSVKIIKHLGEVGIGDIQEDFQPEDEIR